MRRLLAILVVSIPLLTSAQSPTAAQNLRTCLSGKYPALCNHSLLTPSEAQQARAAELHENLNTCLMGKYPALCNHLWLTTSEAQQVRAAELRQNLDICLTGKYPALCNHGLLTAPEAQQVRSAEMRQNLDTCMSGRYPALCNHSLLTPEQASAVATAESRSAAVRPPTTHSRTYRPRSGGCESGLSITSVGGDGKVIKLDDGSMWEVDDADTVDTALWLPATEVVVCDGKMINTDDDESAEVTPLTGTYSRPTSPKPSGRSSYTIQAAANDETFMINGEVFKAKTYCFDFGRGDSVIFVEGSALGACVSAKLLNLRNQKICDVWCE